VKKGPNEVRTGYSFRKGLFFP